MDEWTEAKLDLDSKSCLPHRRTFRTVVTWSSGVTFLKSLGFCLLSKKKPRGLKRNEEAF